jgi:diguanylate cyclase (GGDEF)-like protein
MAHTIFILGTDPLQCKEIKDILQGRVSDNIVTANSNELPTMQDSDVLIIAADEKNIGTSYRQVVAKLQQELHRARLLNQLIHLFSSSLQIEDLLDRVVSTTTQVLGDMAFILLVGDNERLQLEATSSTNPERLTKVLTTAFNVREQLLNGDLLSVVLSERQPILIPNLPQANMPADVRPIVEKHGIISLLCVPIQTKDEMLGVFISLSNEKVFTQDDLATASALADFTAIGLENAGLFAELQRSAITDSLTGAYNPRFFSEVLGRESARANRYSTPLSLLMIDIDTFKLVNDTFGHVVGNKVLAHVAKVLQQTVRNTDFVFRCGGDEFGVVLPGTDLEGAMHVALKILQRVEKGEILSSLSYTGTVTVSIGVSEYRHGINAHFETLVAEADQALYMAKRTGKNCAKPFRPALGSSSSEV